MVSAFGLVLGAFFLVCLPAGDGNMTHGRTLMNTPSLIASAITAVFALGLVVYRLLWAASQTAGAAALGRLPKLHKSWRRFLFGERNDTPTR